VVEVTNIIRLNRIKSFLTWCGFKYARPPAVSQLRAQALFVFLLFIMILFVVTVEEPLGLRSNGTTTVLWLVVAFDTTLAVAIGLVASLQDLPGLLVQGIVPRSDKAHDGPEKRAARAAALATRQEANRYNWAVSLGLLDLVFIYGT
jgi:hypothetical protein